MSSSNAPLPNDPYAWIDRYAADLHRASRDLARDGEASRVSDEAVAQLLTAAIRLYYMKADVEERTFSPVIREQTDPLTATEVLSAVSELLRALRLGPMELALWFRRRPDERIEDLDPQDSEKKPGTHQRRRFPTCCPRRRSASSPTPARSWRTLSAMRGGAISRTC